MKRLLLVGALLAGGCTHALDFEPTMASDPPQIGIEGIALITELSRAYEPANTAICQKVALGYQESRKQTVARYRKGSLDALDQFRCIGFRTPGAGQVAAHVKAGFALSDYFCDDFFDRIAEHSGKRRFARNTTNDVGALMSTILGLASAGSGWTGGISAAFGLADSAWRNYDENFLVYADLPAVQKLVNAEQDKMRKTYVAPDNYPDATNLIIRYANLCSFVGMRGLLTESMVLKAAGEQNPLDGSRILDAVKGDRTLREAIREIAADAPLAEGDKEPEQAKPPTDGD